MRALNLLLMITCFSNISFAKMPPMELQGKGVANYLGFIKVYDAYLYAPPTEDSEEILASNISKCLTLKYAVSLSPEDFITAADKILSKQHSSEKLQMMQAQIEALHKAYKPVKKGDSYQLCYHGPTNTTSLALNQEQLVSIVSAEFGKAYLGIWLGPQQPLDQDLRDKLLGKSK